MTVETATYISDLDTSLPAGGDSRAEGDNHIRLIKSTLKATFPNVNAAVTATDEQMNFLVGVTSALQDQLNAANGRLCEGRLTAQSGVAVPLSDISGATSLYFTAFKGNRVGVYSSGKWVPLTLTEISIDVPTANAVYDVFVYGSGGPPLTTLNLELVAWASDTARATALTYQDGVLVKNGDATRRYLGTIYAQSSGGGTLDDTLTKRYVWNYYNRLQRGVRVVEASTAWLYNGGAWRQANANAANQFNFVCGIVEDWLEARLAVNFENAGAGQQMAATFGYDSTSAVSTYAYGGAGAPILSGAVTKGQCDANIIIQPAVGKHYLAWIEWADTSIGNTFNNIETVAFERSQSGMVGTWAC